MSQKNILFRLFPLFICVVGIIANGENMVSMGECESPPVINGSLDDQCWKYCMEITGFVIPVKLNYARDQTSVRFCHDGRMLYGSIICYQKNSDKLRQGAKSKDAAQMWTENGIEMFFIPGTNFDQYKQVIINAEGSVYDSAYRLEGGKWTSDLKWDSGLKTAVRKQSDKWVIEFSAPFKKLGSVPREGESWRMNVVRNNPVTRDNSSWSPLIKHSWRQPEKFGRLLFSKNACGLSLHGLPQLNPKAEFSLEFQNRTSGKYDVDLNVSGKVIKKDAVVSAGKATQLAFDYFVKGQRGDTPNSVILSIENNSNLLYRLNYTPESEYIAISPGNVPSGTFYISPDMPAAIEWNMIHTFPGFDKATIPKKYNIIFEVPGGITVENSKQTGETNRHGEIFIQLAAPQYRAASCLGYVRSVFNTSLPEGSSGVFYFYPRWDDGEQKPQTLKFKVIRIKPTDAPKRFITGIYNLWPRSAEDALPYKKSGINTISIYHNNSYNESAVKLVNDLKKAGFYVRYEYYFPGGPDRTPYAKWAEEDREARARDIGNYYVSGRTTFQLSPSYRGKYFEEAIEKESEFIKKTGINWFGFDMEKYVIPDGAPICFHQRTLARFEKYFAEKHPDMKYIDPRTFEADPKEYPKYHSIWVDFKSWIWADFFMEFKRRLQSAVDQNQTCPKKGVVISEWSFCRPWDEQYCNKTLRGIEFVDAFDYFEVSAYSGVARFVYEHSERLAELEKYFPNKEVDFIAAPSPERLDYNRDANNYYYSPAPILPAELKYKILEAAAFGMKGVLGFNRPGFTSESYKYWCEGIAVVNKIEDIVLDGRRIADLSCDQPLGTVDEVALHNRTVILRDQPKVLVKGMELDDRAIIAVSEYRDLRPTTVKVTYPVKEPSSVTDVETGEKIGEISPDSPEFKVSLDKMRCRMLLVTPLNKGAGK